MGLLQRAVETYDHFEALAGVERENHATLTPIFHIIQNAQLEISLSSDGSCRAVEAVGKGRTKTIIPATEKSASRSGLLIQAHPLCDQLSYVAPCGGVKYDAYLKELRDWAESPFTSPKLPVILRYVTGGTIVADLLKAGVIDVDANGLPTEKCCKYMIRWRVYGVGEPSACWEDAALFRAYINYRQALDNGAETELCMVSGQEGVPAQSHPKGVIAFAYGAKLISANDTSGFTYRGRFTEARQAATVASLASQKAHCALQWIVSDQGVAIGERTFVCWNPKGLPVTAPVMPYNGSREDEKPLTPSDYKTRLCETILGYRAALPDDEDVVVAALEAATTGRLSVTYYSEQKGADYWDRLEKWYASCCWSFGKFGVQSPSIIKIAKYAFGVQRGASVELDGKILREQTQRLLPCVVSAAPIPEDVVRAIASRVKYAINYSTGNHIQLISTACAVIRKFHNDKALKEEYTMQLDPNKNDSSYQYGRLLAVFEKIERDANDTDENRDTHAMRMLSVFKERPLHAVECIRRSLIPYYGKLARNKYPLYKEREKLIQQILSQIDETKINQSLDDTYILGYYLQKQAFYTSKKTKTEEN